jgi:hypothetical protein
MILITADIHTCTIYNIERYDNEKERRHALGKGKTDMRNSPGSAVWFVDVTPEGITTGPVEGQ